MQGGNYWGEGGEVCPPLDAPLRPGAGISYFHYYVFEFYVIVTPSACMHAVHACCCYTGIALAVKVVTRCHAY